MTRVAVLTAPGRGALAVVRVWGPGSVATADAAFRPVRGPGLARSPAGRLRLGRMGEGPGDEVVAAWMDTPHGPEAEVHCHGGPAAVELVVAALVDAGATRAEPGEWVAHAADSPLAADAWLDLPHAPTVRTAAILLDQAEGALDRALQTLGNRLESDLAEALAFLDELIGRASVGLRLRTGWRVALAGRPNVGKSRLMNALAGFERAIVAPTPGTTRDVVTASLAVDGWPVELADTAGLRPTDDAIEAAGVALARARQAEADLVVLVLDRSEPLTPADHALIAAHPTALLVASKADLPAAWEPPDGALTVSAARGDGLDALLSALSSRLVPDPPPPGAAVPFRPEHLHLLEEVRHHLAAGDRKNLQRPISILMKK